MLQLPPLGNGAWAAAGPGPFSLTQLLDGEQLIFCSLQYSLPPTPSCRIFNFSQVLSKNKSRRLTQLMMQQPQGKLSPLAGEYES